MRERSHLSPIVNLQPKGRMKKQYMKVRKEKKDFSSAPTQQEANVEMGISSTRGTVKVLREEIINGKKYLVLSV